jgi:hypothetical protein
VGHSTRDLKATLGEGPPPGGIINWRKNYNAEGGGE